ncbi:glycosyltransferase family 1 protein [Thauera sp.]|uniref:glycosyltransferase family 4 protein n=1 Tax=Thauera sp. TaxID=1905334 RepID=UPI00257DEA4B|nr:glycosyltransferase family 1 protein [Thauera sp.]
MRVGIDARLLTEPFTGIGRYTNGMCRELVKHDVNFFLYMPSRPYEANWNGNRVTVRSGNLASRLGRMLWSQTVLPLNALRDNVDVLWSATHRLPRWLPRNVARVVTVHDLVWRHAPETMRPFSRTLDRVLMPSAVRGADRVIAVSKSTAQDIRAEWPSARDKIRVIHPGGAILPPAGDAKALTQLGIDKQYVLFVGTLEPRKNLSRLLAAFAKLPETVRHGAKLVIAGGKGWGGVDIVRLIGELDLREHVIVTGYVNDLLLSTLYSNARLLAMPSLYEGFGLPLVEAMSRGVPVLVSNISSLPEVAGDAGYQVDPFDVESIADGLLHLLADEVLHESYAMRAVASASRFSWDQAARQALEVFAEAIGERRAFFC